MSTLRSFTAVDEDRLDRMVAQQVPELSRTQAHRLIEEGRVRVNGVLVDHASHAVTPGAQVEIDLPVTADLDQFADAVELDILYADEHTILLNKQAGLLVHPVRGQSHVTLVNAMRARFPEVRDIDEGNRPGVVHRLDRDTSGVMAYARSATAQAYLKEQWRNRETLKFYLTIVEGVVDPPAGIIDAPLGADPDDPRRRAVVSVGDHARSEYEVLEQYGHEAALVRVRIFTGRTHQIRVHMAAIGHPVIADTLYGRTSDVIGRQALHAWRLGLTLASTGEWRQFEAPLPEDMCAAIRTLRARHGTRPALRLAELVTPPAAPRTQADAQTERTSA